MKKKMFGFKPNNRYKIEIWNNGIINKILIRFAFNYDDKISLEFGNKMKYKVPTNVQKL
jgi:hypothetical protein